MRPNNIALFSDASATSTQHSAALDAQNLLYVSLQCISSSGSNAGNILIEGSNDNINPSNWNQIATQAVASGATTSVLATQLCYRWIRATWSPTAGAGTITVNAQTLGF